MNASTDESLQGIIDRLRSGAGGCVAYPTETCWGLGVRGDDPAAVEWLRDLKGRESDQPFSILIPDASWLERLGVRLQTAHQKLIDAFWPGPLTLLFEIRADSPFLHLAAPFLGVRCSSHPQAKKLVESLDIPITSTSANLSGLGNLSDESAVRKLFSPMGVLTLADESGICGRSESTVVGFEDGRLMVYRQGDVSIEALEKALQAR